MVELEDIAQFRFYKLECVFVKRCFRQVENIYTKTRGDKVESHQYCNGLLNLHMIDSSINLICPHCRAQYDIIRICNKCGKHHMFEDMTCDNCEPIVINITTWKVSIEEANKTIKKVNRAFKKGVIDEAEWKNVLNIQKDEIKVCQENLEKVEKNLNLSIN